LVASFPPVGLAPLAWVAFWPLLFALNDAPARARLALGTLAGMVWALGTVAPWLYPAARSHLAAGPLAAAGVTAAAVCAYGGIYLGIFSLVYPKLPAPRWFSAPAAWVLLEQVRTAALGGNPWELIGHSQHAALPLAQLVEVTGVAGLSFLVLMPAAALAAPARERRVGLAVAAALVLGAAVLGSVRLRAFPGAEPEAGGLTVSIMSGQNLDPDPVGRYAEAMRGLGVPHLTVWPETAVPGYLQEDAVARETLRASARAHGWLLVGALRHESRGTPRRYYNSAILLDPSGSTRGVYDKHMLVPIAERPTLPLLPSVARPFSPGEGPPAPLATDRLKLGVLVCWEAIFPEPSRTYARDGADVLVNLTSDRDLGIGAAQLLAFSRFRAIETRRWLIRASGTGMSYVVDPAGRLSQRSTVQIAPGAQIMTPYVRYGEAFSWGVGSALLLLGLRTAVRARG